MHRCGPLGTTGVEQAQRQGQSCKAADLRFVSEIEVSLLVAPVSSRVYVSYWW